MKYKKVLILSLLSVVCSTSFAQVSEGSIVYKYRDTQGNLIYSDNMPSNEKGQYSVLSGKSGVLKKVVEKELSIEEIEVVNEQKETKQNTEIQFTEQRKRDNGLLSTYSSVDEISKLKNFEISQINQAIKTQITNITDLKDRINQTQKALESNKENIKIKESLEDFETKLVEANNILDSNKDLLQTRSTKYKEDELRYVELLKEMSTKKVEVNK